MWFINVLCKLYVRDHDHLAFDFYRKTLGYIQSAQFDRFSNSHVYQQYLDSRACSKIHFIFFNKQIFNRFSIFEKKNSWLPPYSIIRTVYALLSILYFFQEFWIFYTFLFQNAQNASFIAHVIECLSFLPRTPITYFWFNAKLNCLQQLFNYILRLLCL